MNKRIRKKRKTGRRTRMLTSVMGDGYIRASWHEKTREGWRVWFRIHKDVEDVRHIAEVAMWRDDLLRMPPQMAFGPWVLGRLMDRVEQSIRGEVLGNWLKFPRLPDRVAIPTAAQHEEE